MSWSLQLRNGDLSTSGAQLGQIAGGSKIVQDLRCALLERRGNDDMHPTFGSLIDGGIDQTGNPVPSLIGSSDWDLIASRVEAEIRRVCGDYQTAQVTRSKQDRITYGQSTLTPNELLMEISSLQMFQIQDTLLVRVSLTTATGQSMVIDVPVSNEPLITN